MTSRFLLSLILGALPLTMMAQDDDMYFVPSKKSKASSTVQTVRPAPTYYSGSNRSVDEYNRRGGSYYQVMPSDSTGNDIIDFNSEVGVYPDSTMMGDYELTKQMSRWDGYEPEEAYMDGYRDATRDSWGWHSPWFYSSYYPWYDSYWYWHDPWYYSHWGWYDPWYYDYYYWNRPYWYGGYYHPYWYGGGGYVYSYGPSGTRNHGRINYNSPRGLSNGRTTAYRGGTFGGRSLSTANRGRFGGSRSSAATGTTRTYGTSSNRRTSNAYGNFGGNRSTNRTSSRTSTYTPSNNNSRSYTPSTTSRSSSGGFGGGGNFGGSRSSGGSFGGGSRGGGGGGGHFGGRR